MYDWNSKRTRMFDDFPVFRTGEEALAQERKWRTHTGTIIMCCINGRVKRNRSI